MPTRVILTAAGFLLAAGLAIAIALNNASPKPGTPPQSIQPAANPSPSPALATPPLHAAAPNVGPPVLAQQPAPTRRPPNADPTIVLKAMELVEQNQIVEALQKLDIALELLPESPSRHTAALLKHQLTGAFMKRQSPWHDRDVGNVVVLVDNELDFVHAVEAWTDDLFWPVLIDDGYLAPLFIQSFQPKHVVRWSSPPTDQPPTVRDELTRVRQPHNNKTAQRTGEATPPGIVVIDPDAHLRCAGLALALGRGQPAMFLTGVQNIAKRVNEHDVSAINVPILTNMTKLRLLLKDQWCGITLAGQFPYQLEPEAIVQARREGRSKKGLVLAVDDTLGRIQDGTRLAVVGRLLGPSHQAVYQAMASLFLQPSTVLMFDSYSFKSGNIWQQYAFYNAHQAFEPRYDVTLLAKGALHATEFSRFTQPQLRHDMVWMNSAGGNRKFWIHGKQHGATEDIPIGRAAAFYVVHSFSAEKPWEVWTIAGRALAGGAYWYYGSSDEPQLTGFARPAGVAQKALAGTPLAFAARHLPLHQRGRPWKLAVIGDPLFTLRRAPAPRVEAIPLHDTIPITNDFLATAIAEGQADLRTILKDIAILRASPNNKITLAMAAATANSILGEPDKMRADDVIRAVWLLHQAHRSERLATAPYHMTSRHKLAEQLVAAHRRSDFEKQIDNGNLDTARAILSNMLYAIMDTNQLVTDLRRWLAAMSRANRADEALGWLRRRQDAKPSSFAAGALKTVLQ